MTFMIYLIGVADGVVGVAGAIAALCGIAAVIITLMFVDSEHTAKDDFWSDGKRAAARAWAAALKKPMAGLWLLAGFMALVAAFVPSSKTLAAMYIIPKLAESQELQDSALKVKVLADEWLEGLRPKKVGKE